MLSFALLFAYWLSYKRNDRRKFYSNRTQAWSLIFINNILLAKNMLHKSNMNLTWAWNKENKISSQTDVEPIPS